nr:midasin-like [Procambarus clarkii]
MVDSVSAETRIKELLEESRGFSYPDDTNGIKRRYKDTALILFKQSHEEENPKNYLSFGTRRSSAVSQYGNTPIIVRRSRSSNGELSTVVEQVPSIRGRSSVSDYTLVESKGKDDDDDDDTDTEDELESKKFQKSEETVEENESKDSKNEIRSKDNSLQIHANEILIKNKAENQADLTRTQKNDETNNGLPTQACENRKSFSHYDLPIQRNKDHDELETKSCEKEIEEKNERKVEEIDHKAKLENGKLANENEDLRKVSEKEELPKVEHDNINDTKCHESKSCLVSEGNKGSQSTLYYQESDSKTNTSQDVIEIAKPDCPDIDHEAVLRAYVQQSAAINKSLQEGLSKSCYSDSYQEKLPSDNKYVELKIVESVDKPLNSGLDKGCSTVTKNALTTDILKFGEDDDVIFIDANSPLLARTKARCESSIDSSQELLKTQDNAESWSIITTPTPKHKDQNLCRSSPPLIERSSKPESPQYLKGDSVEDVSKYLETENHSGLLDLPMRCPTPPKRSPRRSPRVPKENDRNRQGCSSLVLPSDDKTEESYPKGTKSASPTSNSKEASKFFSFSLKGEKSKSSSSLSSKKGKDRDRVSAPRIEGKGLPTQASGVINSVTETDSKVGQLETFGKRVGVRSMVIDGTIKRNFIVIHPSDDSETVGLAPLSSASNGKENSVYTSTALLSMKTHLSEPKKDNLESVKRISCKADLKEELSGMSVNDGISLNIGQMSKSLRIKKKITGRKIVGSSQSLSSESTSFSFADSQAIYRSSLVLPDVDTSSVVKSSQHLNNSSSRTVSKLCVVM